MLPTHSSQSQNTDGLKPLPGAPVPADTIQVLVVDRDATIVRTLNQMSSVMPMAVHHAGTTAEARGLAAAGAIDIAFIDMNLPDGESLSLAQERRRECGGVGSVIAIGPADFEHSLEAMRNGACDYLSRPIHSEDLALCLGRILSRRADRQRVAERLLRLKDLCRKLNKARHQMTHQVDSLCHDMASAYKDLEGKMKHAQLIERFKTLVGHELDLEKVLRRFLEVVLQEVGPTNAVVFLPSTQGQFAVGGYINYNLDKSSVEAMLSHLADTAGPKIAEGHVPVGLSSSDAIDSWLGEPNAWLAGRAAMALPCRTDDSVMAGVLLFRDAADPYNASTIEALGALAPVLAGHLTRVIHIHHRMVNNDKALEQGDGADPDDAQF